jgi:hypothetical protein
MCFSTKKHILIKGCVFAMVLMIGLEPIRSCPRGILSPLRLPIPPHQHVSFVLFFWRHHPESNWGIKVLQTSALPLGYGAEFFIILYYMFLI